MMNRSLISFNRDKIYTSLENPDLNFSDQKLELLIRLINELGEFGYIIDSNAIRYLDIPDIKEYIETIIPILYQVYKHKEYIPGGSINISDWKRRHTDDFYNSGDFIFISESSKRLNLPITYLDRMVESDLYNLYMKIVGSSKDPSIEEENELSYLSTIFSNVYSSVAGNKTSKLLLNLVNKNHKFNTIFDALEYSNYRLSRNERRLVLEKIELLIDSNGLESTIVESRGISKKSWLKFFKNIHPQDYKNVFSKTYEFYVYLSSKKYSIDISKKSAFEAAKMLIDSRPDEFVNQFGALMLKAEEENNGSEADIASLLCTGKLEIHQLTEIINYLQKKELGIPRFYNASGSIKKCNKCFDRRIIPTIKEFILNGISIKNKKEAVEKLRNKKIWLDPELRTYDYIDNEMKISYHKEYLGKVQLGNKIVAKTFWDDRQTIYYSYTSVHLWKGVGSGFKVVDYRYEEIESGREATVSNHIDIKLYKSLGYKYIIFYNRTSYQYEVVSDSPVYFQITEPKGKILAIIQSRNECRNRFGGLLDLNNGDLWLINSDISLLPTYNGNLCESIIRHIFDQFRFSVYDYIENYCISSGAIIVESENICDIKYTPEDYKLNKLI